MVRNDCIKVSMDDNNLINVMDMYGRSLQLNELLAKYRYSVIKYDYPGKKLYDLSSKEVQLYVKVPGMKYKYVDLMCTNHNCAMNGQCIEKVLSEAISRELRDQLEIHDNLNIFRANALGCSMTDYYRMMTEAIEDIYQNNCCENHVDHMIECSKYLIESNTDFITNQHVVDNIKDNIEEIIEENKNVNIKNIVLDTIVAHKSAIEYDHPLFGQYLDHEEITKKYHEFISWTMNHNAIYYTIYDIDDIELNDVLILPVEELQIKLRRYMKKNNQLFNQEIIFDNALSDIIEWQKEYLDSILSSCSGKELSRYKYLVQYHCQNTRRFEDINGNNANDMDYKNLWTVFNMCKIYPDHSLNDETIEFNEQQAIDNKELICKLNHIFAPIISNICECDAIIEHIVEVNNWEEYAQIFNINIYKLDNNAMKNHGLSKIDTDIIDDYFNQYIGDGNVYMQDYSYFITFAAQIVLNNGIFNEIVGKELNTIENIKYFLSSSVQELYDIINYLNLDAIMIAKYRYICSKFHDDQENNIINIKFIELIKKIPAIRTNIGVKLSYCLSNAMKKHIANHPGVDVNDEFNGIKYHIEDEWNKYIDIYKTNDKIINSQLLFELFNWRHIYGICLKYLEEITGQEPRINDFDDADRILMQYVPPMDSLCDQWKKINNQIKFQLFIALIIIVIVSVVTLFLPSVPAYMMKLLVIIIACIVYLSNPLGPYMGKYMREIQ